MDLSKQTNTSTSMYFDAESSASTSAFKTFEANSDISNASTVSANDSIGANGTLEYGRGDENAAILMNPNLVALKTNHHSNNFPTSPLCAFPKNILQEYLAHCSTPTKEQLVRTVEIERGSEATSDCIDLRVAFRGADDEKILNIATTISTNIEENKENALPEKSCEVSTLSQSSSVGIVTIIDRNKLCTNESVADCEDVNRMEIVEVLKEEIKIDASVNEIKSMDFTKDKDTKDEQAITTDAPKVNIKRVPLKARRSLLPTKGARKSICEPDLKNNRPSRISLHMQRNINMPKTMLEALYLKRKTDNNMDTEIPKLLTKALNLNQQLVEVSTTSSSSSSSLITKSKSMAVTNKSKLKPPITISMPEKRTYPYAQRMSTMVKTTLNSPARKVMRRSMLPPVYSTANSNANAAARRSIMPPVKATNNSVSNNRRSMLPQSARSQAGATKPSSSTVSAASSDKLKSVTQPPPIISKKKAITKISEYKCTVCSAKFSIKSLLDAHKRSHEDGVPAFVRKPAAVINSNNSSNNNISNSNNNNNQCKYCDKKFALLRTLHIHLMENCIKIPPSEKRKLVFTEMQHVEKAQLPTFSQSHVGNTSNASSLTESRGESTLSLSDNMTKNNSKVLTRELAEAMGELDLSPVDNTHKNQLLMAPPTISKVKKSSAHAGVYRTPTKSVPCHICKISFKSVLEYTHHSMQTHGNNNDEEEQDKNNESEV